jgi:putative ABC transport system ATP-binding protein
MTELLSIEGVSKSYRRGERRLRVLHDLSLAVREAEIVAVVSSRFEGKSTLLRIAAGIEEPDEGTVSLKGLRLSDLPVRDREQLRPSVIGWASREGSGIDLRVLDHLALPLLLAGHSPPEAQEIARAMLARVDAPDVGGLRWSELSNWERLLVSLARSVIRSPRLLVLDDLLDGLGFAKTEQASDLLRSLVVEHGCGVLLSVSDVDAGLGADRIYTFEDGRLCLLAGSGEVLEFPRRGRRRADG